MNDLYERNETLRQNLDQAQIEYFGDIPVNTGVYLEKPQIIHPLTQKGEPSKRKIGWSGIPYVCKPMSAGIKPPKISRCFTTLLSIFSNTRKRLEAVSMPNNSRLAGKKITCSKCSLLKIRCDCPGL
jgi:hypothetical protein